MSAAAAPRIEVGKALKDACLTALITFALFLTARSVDSERWRG